MTETSKERYDDTTKTLWVFRKYADPDTLVPNDEMMALSKSLRSGKLDDGREVKHIGYVFADDATAEYNEAALSFAKLGTYTGSLEKPKAFDETSSFKVEEDFGM